MTRKEAIELGLNHYNTNRPCKRGHLCDRRVSNNGCVECAKINLQVWRVDNKEHVNQRDSTYRVKTKKRRNDLERQRYNNNPDKFRAKTRKYYANNIDIILQKREKYYYEVEAKDESRKLAASARTKEWARDNPERALANAKSSKGRRRAIESQAHGKFTAEDVIDIRRMQKDKCAMTNCRVKLGGKGHLDHIVALVNGGSNDRKNLQLLCAPCNLKKARKDPLDFAREQGLLL